MAHIAFAYDAAIRVVLRNSVGAVPGAVLAPDAGVRVVTDDTGYRIFGVGVHRAASHAGGFEAVIAANGEIMALSERVSSAFDLAHASPENVGRIAILLVACNNAALAADALRHVEVKPVLLARARSWQFVTV